MNTCRYICEYISIYIQIDVYIYTFDIYPKSWTLNPESGQVGVPVVPVPGALLALLGSDGDRQPLSDVRERG